MMSKRTRSPPLLEAWIEIFFIEKDNKSTSVASFVGGVD